MGGARDATRLGALIGLVLLTACAGGTRADRAERLYTPSGRLLEPVRITLLETSQAPPRPHFVPETRSFRVAPSARELAATRVTEPPRLGLRPAAHHPKSESAPRSSRADSLLSALGAPRLALGRGGPSADDVYLTLGTGIVDPEKEPSWTSAAVYPMDESRPELPALRVVGQTGRSYDRIQVAPGLLWWPTRSCCVSLSVPLGLGDAAPEWGVLLAVRY